MYRLLAAAAPIFMSIQALASNLGPIGPTLSDIDSNVNAGLVQDGKSPQNTLASEVRDAVVLISNEGAVTLTAQVFLGSNPCLAEGVKLNWTKKTVGSKVLMIPQRSLAKTQSLCSSEHNPVYSNISTTITGDLKTIFLANYRGRSHQKVLNELVAVLQLKTFGGYCQNRCPESSLTVKQDGDISETRTIFSDWNGEIERIEFQELGILSAVAMKNLGRRIQNTEKSKLYNSTPDDPYCADTPENSYILTKPDMESFVFARYINCHLYKTRDFNAESLLSFLTGLNSIRR